jgi:hypothetical protein
MGWLNDKDKAGPPPAAKDDKLKAKAKAKATATAKAKCGGL